MMVLLQISATFIVLISVVGQGYASDDTITEELPFEIYNNASGYNDETEYSNETGVYQGDIILNEQQIIREKLKKALLNENSRWPEGDDGFPRVPYVFLDNVNQDDVRAGIDHWTDNTCLKFHETNNKSQPHLQFYIGNGCSSWLGMQHQNGQKVSIGTFCNNLGTVAHEIGHAIGFYHEQSRSDRDDYVIILLDNVKDGKKHNFRKGVDNNFNVTYDYTSVMHYGDFGFSKNGLNTIFVKDPLAQELIGNRDGLSHRDILLANRMYKCIDKWIKNCSLTSDPCLNDGYTGKNCECICPPGTSGSNCGMNLTDYYAHKRNPISERITSEKTFRIVSPSRGKFTKWITPPSCMRVVLTVKHINMWTACWAQYFIVRTDPDNSGQKKCYANIHRGTRIQSDWQIILTMYNRVGYSEGKVIMEAEVKFKEISGCSRSSTTTHSTTEMTSQEPTTTHPTTKITSPEPTSSPGTCPICPTTPATITCPTIPATCPPTTMSTSCPITTCPPVPTIPITTTKPPPPSKLIRCVHKGEYHTIRIARGRAVTIISPRFPSRYPQERFTCGWKLKAKRRGRLTVTCDYFRVHHRDKLVIESEKGIFRSNQRPYFDINQLVIKFKSRKNSHGRGFRCTIVSE